ncbi:hypothetical protein D0T25_20580 [Duganella sp. BJB488]|uniref:hypothetical protein n=2 Tax=Duganella TaxID=75654 RepID=UPI000E345EB0|nr:hypothetical protein [Duganella sp. BJB488]RFP17889.1 hypothetical protein D0T26_16960 [Duganella sp. BJB489]RFP17975.1 hypothetical protein D0T25_20580 [Duganella sp. BJB488]
MALFGSAISTLQSQPYRRGTQMKEPGLDNRHRDKDGTIQQKRSDTQNQNLSQPIPGFGPKTTLGTMREKTGQVSEKDVRQAAKKMSK